MWTRGCFIETVYAPLPLCAVQLCCPPLSLLLSITDNAKEAALLSTHTLYYILRTFRLLSHYYIIAFNSQRAFIQCGALVVLCM